MRGLFTKTQFIDAIRNIRREWVSFLSIMLISFMAVSCYVGISSGKTAFFDAANKYYDRASFRDMEIISTVLLSSSDIEDIKKLDGVKDAEGIYQTEALVRADNSRNKVIIQSMTERINIPIIKEGCAPESLNECMIEASFARSLGYSVGDRVIVEKSHDLPPEYLIGNEYIVTGIFDHPDHICKTAVEDPYILVPANAFDTDKINGCFMKAEVLMDKPAGINRYEKAYARDAEELKKRLRALGDEAAPRQYESLHSIFLSKLDENKDILDNAKEKLDDAAEELKENETKLNEADDALKDFKSRLADAKAELENGDKKLKEAEKTLAENKTKLEDAEEELRDAEEELADGKKKLDDGAEQLAEARQKLEDGWIQLDNGKGRLKDAEKKLEDASDELDEADENLGLFDRFLKVMDKYLNGVPIVSEVEEEVSHTPELIELYIRLSKILEKLGIETDPSLDGLIADNGVADGLSLDLNDLENVDTFKEKVREAIRWMENEGANLPISEERRNDYYQLLELGKEIYETAFGEFEDGKEKYNRKLREYEEGKAEYEKGLNEFNEGMRTYDEKETEYHEKENEYLEGLQDYNDGKQEYEEGLEKYEKGLKDYNSGLSKYENGKKEYEENLAKYNESDEMFQDAKKEFAAAKKEYNDNLKKYEDGLKQFEEAAARGDGLTMGNWVIMGTDGNVGFVQAKLTIGMINGIANRFSILFIFIGAIVIYSTVGKIIDEQHKLVGAVKALGFFNSEMLGKYLFYGVGATIIGVLAGEGISFIIQRYALNVATSSFIFPETEMAIRWDLMVAILIPGIALSTVAVLLACRRLVRQNAIDLMKDTMPEGIGKSVVKHHFMTLYQRLILRNMRSDIKRIFVTVISITGCCMLLVIGFTWQKEFFSTPVREYGEIIKYDYDISFNMNDDKNAASKLTELISSEGAEGYPVSRRMTKFETGALTDYADLIVMESDDIEKLFDLKDTSGRNDLRVRDDGIYITSGFGESYELKAGDTVRLTSFTGDDQDVRIGGVYKNYLGQMVFVTPDYYNSVFAKTPEADSIMMKCNDADREKLIEMLGAQRSFERISGSDRLQYFFDSNKMLVLALMGMLTVEAAMMAAVILTNLTNIYLSQKQGELTIMRINGFRVNEVIGYVLRETYIVSSIGIVLGCVAGYFMTLWMIQAFESPYFRYVKEPDLMSFLKAGGITIFFLILVNAFCLRKVRNLKLTDVTN